MAAWLKRYQTNDLRRDGVRARRRVKIARIDTVFLSEVILSGVEAGADHPSTPLATALVPASGFKILLILHAVRLP